MSPLLLPFQFIRDARRVLRLPDARPDAWAHFRCWVSQRFAASKDSAPVRAQLGDLVLHAHNHEELSFLFEEVFLRQDYKINLPTGDPVIIDCGANIGFATVYLKQHYPAARITCFEPNPSCFKLLQQHITENHLTNITAHQVACGNQNGEISFFVSPGFSPLSSMFGSRAKDAQEIKVRLVKLSDYLTGPVDLFKLDVEGAEWGIFEDLIASGKLALIQRMIIEYHHRIGGAKPELSRFLKLIEDAGFTYDIEAFISPLRKFSGAFQDVMIYASRPGK